MSATNISQTQDQRITKSQSFLGMGTEMDVNLSLWFLQASLVLWPALCVMFSVPGEAKLILVLDILYIGQKLGLEGGH